MNVKDPSDDIGWTETLLFLLFTILNGIIWKYSRCEWSHPYEMDGETVKRRGSETGSERAAKVRSGNVVCRGPIVGYDLDRVRPSGERLSPFERTDSLVF
jgi:hypothetical protein